MPSPLPGRGKTEAPSHEDLSSVPPAAERSWPSDCASPSADTIQPLRSRRNHHSDCLGVTRRRFGELPEPSLLAARTAAKNEGSSFPAFAGDSAVIGVVPPSVCVMCC